jgi:hypothetical protein
MERLALPHSEETIESLCEAYDPLTFSAFPPSCGNTAMSFASLFLDTHNINLSSLHSVISGGFAAQLWNNPNILLFYAAKQFSRLSPPPASVLSRYKQKSFKAFCKISQNYCQRRANHSLSILREDLLRDDPDHLLPRIFFLSASWAWESQLPNDPYETGLQDHEMIIIKRAPHTTCSSEKEFQLLQGYLPSETEPGYDLEGWQANCRNLFSSIDGFDRKTLTQADIGIPKRYITKIPTPAWLLLF